MSTTTTTPRASGRPRTKPYDGTYIAQGYVQLSPEEAAIAERALAAADSDPNIPVSTSIRWSRQQIEVVTRAAALAGVPYQTYLKTVAYRAALADLQAAQTAGVG